MSWALTSECLELKSAVNLLNRSSSPGLPQVVQVTVVTPGAPLLPPLPHDCRIASTPLIETPSASARLTNSRRPILPRSKSCAKSCVVLMDLSLLHSFGLPALRMYVVLHLAEYKCTCERELSDTTSCVGHILLYVRMPSCATLPRNSVSCSPSRSSTTW